MKLRPLTKADIPELRDMAIRIYRQTFSELNTSENMEAFVATDYSTERFEQEFAMEGSWYFFAMDGEQAVGYLRMRESDEVEHHLGKSAIELHRLYVDNSYHGKGVGDFLMQEAINIAKEKKRDWIWLGVWEKNPRAQRFYQKWGYEKFAEHIFQMGDDAQTDWLLKKDLRN